MKEEADQGRREVWETRKDENRSRKNKVRGKDGMKRMERETQVGAGAVYFNLHNAFLFFFCCRKREDKSYPAYSAKRNGEEAQVR